MGFSGELDEEEPEEGEAIPFPQMNGVH